LVLLPLVPSAAGGAPQRQVWLSPAGSIADGGGNGDPPGVEVPGVGGDRSFPPGGGSSVDHRHISAGITDAGARGQRTLFQPLPPASIRLGLAPRRARPRVVLPRGGPVVCWHSFRRRTAARRSHVGQWVCATTGTENLRARALVMLPQVHGVPRVPRRTSTAPEPTVSVPRHSGPVGDPLSVLGRGGRCQTRHGSLRVGVVVVLPQAHGVPGMSRVSNGETPWPRSFGLKLPDR